MMSEAERFALHFQVPPVLAGAGSELPIGSQFPLARRPRRGEDPLTSIGQFGDQRFERRADAGECGKPLLVQFLEQPIVLEVTRRCHDPSASEEAS
jgi:hypothetical protein